MKVKPGAIVRVVNSRLLPSLWVICHSEISFRITSEMSTVILAQISILLSFTKNFFMTIFVFLKVSYKFGLLYLRMSLTWLKGHFRIIILFRIIMSIARTSGFRNFLDFLSSRTEHLTDTPPLHFVAFL